MPEPGEHERERVCDDALRAELRVSVAMITFNHECFIEQAVLSVLMQEVDFSFELVVGDDCSTDRTRAILSDLAARHPGRIRLLDRPNRLGAARNFVDVLRNCRGQYIALLEGDDYWTAKVKLKKQVALMDDHPEHALCFHWAHFLDEGSGRPPHGRYGPVDALPVYTLDDLLAQGNFIPTASVMFRSHLVGRLPDWYVGLKLGDWPLNVLNATCGTIGFLDECMGVYRRHRNGVYNGAGELQRSRSEQEVYQFVGANAALNRRHSFRVGMARIYLRLCWILRSQRETRSATLMASRALRIAPWSRKPSVVAELARLGAKRVVGKFRDCLSR